MEYKIIGTGSSGNAVRINQIMFDCGMPFKVMKPELYKVDSLMITHSHGDHIKPETYLNIRKYFPNIKIYANAHVAYQYGVDRVVGSAPFVLPRGRKITPFDGHHDVPVTGYIVEEKGGNYLYMTDTNRVEMPIDIPLDYVFLESNYDERSLAARAAKYRRAGYDPLWGTLRHLSTQKCKEFYYLHRRNADSVLVELHQSKRFY